MKVMNLAVKLRNQFVESLLKSLGVALLSALHRLDDGSKLANLLDALSEVVLVLLLDLELELSESVVYLAEQVNSISNVLEVFIRINQMTVLFNELLNIANGLREVREGFSKPLL